MGKEMIIEKSITVDRDVHQVFEFLRMTRNQDRFSVWNMKDPSMKKTYSGTDGTKGFIYTWDSRDKNVGAGSQETGSLAEDSRIDYELRFERPMKNTAQASFVLEKKGETSTGVTWTFRSRSKFPMSLFAPIFANMLGKQLAQGLRNLKEVLEK